MRNLNKKGFTLVELLAVIIILAIVVGITIPAVMTTVTTAKVKAFSTSAATCADWIQRQYDAYQIYAGDESLDADMKRLFTNLRDDPTPALTNSLVTACGLKTANVDAGNSKFKITSGKVCLLLAAKSDGDYANQGKFTSEGATATEETNTNYTVGGSCDSFN